MFGGEVFLRWLAAESEAGLSAAAHAVPAQASVPLPAGRWRVRATQTTVGEEDCVGLVQLLPCAS
ncbi:hypothetical protein [Streptomyces sp. NPDC019224]|uniref:hypothetical protein n=1 Tax=Streptomyces sp. NPDC019224 TaxID=3154484 RepID=UPI0033D9EE34